ncbi:MAG: hypothetical protein COW24_04450 [Candidatus Kerfeldbacteria bacterium CG15_BIG_FIL_POST_REV_8_21_14_020_45_12]|uniref:DoxX family protein n=1 Tax=Candidatus Kerfeldbacteria bacterium CG15_BIG_FIL_POST_REV_8_21_14_020_45_12 TaxID=2014247 RepID=A0A2M7H2X6_9BACT|nr:MAG: hypothetical protein COW24_04450 [Candidatus Kerfeldbacteria bacterium CG15_BIG_FIL_POST_REV_8_21_14_020_45_12]PJA93343.1 MAG: hypothetical protein CO132_03225 [Candidatus Kerfeldbacteria bacterium CG_4_9_14_3_um_filter_45_8]
MTTDASTKTPVWAALTRITLGLIMLWAFIDKVFGLGFATVSGKSWLDGVSPTAGFLQHGASGPFTSLYNAIGGTLVVDWLFMLGLLLIGLALILGVAMRLACYSAALLFLLMWSAVLPPKNNPILDDHIVYLLVVLWLNSVNAGNTWGLGTWWQNTGLVKKLPFLK